MVAGCWHDVGMMLQVQCHTSHTSSSNAYLYVYVLSEESMKVDASRVASTWWSNFREPKQEMLTRQGMEMLLVPVAMVGSELGSLKTPEDP